jgi:dehydrogenase/reductase SDR family protein 13
MNGTKYDFTKLKEADAVMNSYTSYGNSKLANAMHARKLSQMLKDSGVTTYSLHPGVVATDVWRSLPGLFQPVVKWFMLTEEQGAMTQLYCATSPELVNETGKYYDDCQEVKYNPLVDDQAAVDELYEKSMEMLSTYLK